MPQENVETVRGLMNDHMTPDAPLHLALDAVCRELSALRRGMEALVERIEPLEEHSTVPREVSF